MDDAGDELDDMTLELFRETTRRLELEQQLAAQGLYLVAEGEGVVDGKMWRLRPGFAPVNPSGKSMPIVDDDGHPLYYLTPPPGGQE